MRGPLEGIRVFDLTLIMVGPWTTMNLGALGADVIHVERPDAARISFGGGIPPYINGTSIGHITWNMNKRQTFFDLKAAFDNEMARKLIATCDVFVDNMRPGVADRLGLSYEALSEINPGIVYCTICGWGTTGPLSDRTAADPQIQAFTGFAGNSGKEGGRAEVYRHFTQMDASTGNYATMTILMALLQRERTGKGQRIDLNMVRAGTAVQATKIGEYLATGEQPPAPRQRVVRPSRRARRFSARRDSTSACRRRPTSSGTPSAPSSASMSWAPTRASKRWRGASPVAKRSARHSRRCSRRSRRAGGSSSSRRRVCRTRAS